jgi:VWFA-related protein
MDPGTGKELKAEFKKTKDYVLVDSVEKADLIFLVEGYYFTYWLHGGGVRLNYTLHDYSAGFGRQGCMAAIAIVVPSEVYLRNPANAEALLAARLWEGVSLWKLVPGDSLPISIANLRVQSASPKELVEQFLKQEKWPEGVPPVSAAWALAPLHASDAVSVKPGRKTVDARQPVMPDETRTVPSGDQVIRVSTTLVTVPVIATDVEGKCVSDLTLTDFHLYENGVEQKIDRLISESAPFQTALMMDISPSTGLVRSDIEAAALSFAKGLRPDDELMVLSFTNRIYVESELTRDQSQLRRAITQSRARGGTPYFGVDPVRRQDDRTRSMGTRLYDAVDLGVTDRFDRFSGRKAILLFTDGVDTGSRLANSQSTIARIEESDVLVYVVRYDAPVPKVDVINRKRDRDSIAGAVAAYAQGADYLQQLATRSGGRLFNASTDAGFRKAFSAIAEEMGRQYTLCYYPTAALNDSSFRRIQVTVDKPGIKIRARAGYRPVAKPSGAK